MKTQPPRWITYLILHFVDPDIRDGVYGDLLEDYYRNVDTSGSGRADLKFVYSAIQYLRFPFLLKIAKTSSTMTHMGIWKNYFISSYRNLTRNKQNTYISILGLTVSFMSSLAIFQYAFFETNYDGFHPHIDRLYRLSHQMTNAAGTANNAVTFLAVNEDLREELPGLESITHILNANDALIRRDDQFIKGEQVIFTTPTFFDVFGFDLMEGNAADLEDPATVFLAKSLARTIFGDQQAVGQSLKLEGIFGQSWEARVSGVFEDMPPNTHLRGKMLLPVNRLTQYIDDGTIFGDAFTTSTVRWRWMSFHTYARLAEGADLDRIILHANEIVDTNRKPFNEQLNQHHEVWLQPVQSIHTTAGIEMELSPVNDRQVINLLVLIGVCILLIAWINYVNLTSARAVTRGKEVGIRKVLGSYKSQLRIQFLTEAFLVNTFAMMLAVICNIPLHEPLENLVGVEFFTGWSANVVLLGLMLFMVVVGTLLSGLYPAYILSNYQIVQILRGRLKNSGKGIILRRFLVITQFIFTMFLISGLLVIRDQMNFMIGHDLGISTSQTIIMDAPFNAMDQEDYSSRMNSLKNELHQQNGIQKVAFSSMVPGIQNFWRNSTEDPKNENGGMFIHRSMVDHDYLELYDLEIIAGRNFDPSFGVEANSILVNENVTRRLGYDSPEEALGEEIRFVGQSFEIVGIVNDFYQRGVQFAVEPMTFSLDSTLTGTFISVKFNSNTYGELVNVLEKNFKQFFPDSPFRARLLDDVFEAQYNNEERFKNLFTVFTVIALMVASLGLLGLASYIMNQRIKEISIRKVLGASGSNLFFILNKEYAVVGMIAFVISIPLTVWVMQRWLEDYANRIDLNAVYFLVPLLAILIAILLTTLGHTLRILRVNPATILKNED